MTVKRIVANLEASDPQASSDFYAKLFGLNMVMDQGWIITLASESATTPQISIASSGGSGTPVPHVSIEVDNLDEVYQKACQADCEIVYELRDEPWGVRRFFVRDPSGKLLNVLAHRAA